MKNIFNKILDPNVLLILLLSAMVINMVILFDGFEKLFQKPIATTVDTAKRITGEFTNINIHSAENNGKLETTYILEPDDVLFSKKYVYGVYYNFNNEGESPFIIDALSIHDNEKFIRIRDGLIMDSNGMRQKYNQVIAFNKDTMSEFDYNKDNRYLIQNKDSFTGRDQMYQLKISFEVDKNNINKLYNYIMDDSYWTKVKSDIRSKSSDPMIFYPLLI